MEMEKELYTIQEVADYFRVHRTAVHRFLKDGLRSVKIGRSRRIPRICLEEYVRERTTP